MGTAAPPGFKAVERPAARPHGRAPSDTRFRLPLGDRRTWRRPWRSAIRHPGAASLPSAQHLAGKQLTRSSCLTSCWIGPVKDEKRPRVEFQEAREIFFARAGRSDGVIARCTLSRRFPYMRGHGCFGDELVDFILPMEDRRSPDPGAAAADELQRLDHLHVARTGRRCGRAGSRSASRTPHTRYRAGSYGWPAYADWRLQSNGFAIGHSQGALSN